MGEREGVQEMAAHGPEISGDGHEAAVVVQTTTTRDDAELALRVYRMLDGHEAFSNMSEFHVTPVQGEDGAIVGVQVTGIQPDADSGALHTQLFDIRELGDSLQLESEPPNPEEPCGDVMEEKTNASEIPSAEPQEAAVPEPPAQTAAAAMLYSCTDCKFSSGNLAALRRHLRRHSDKYKCKLCEKPFACATELRIHMNVHLGIKPHKCSQCDMAYSTAADLLRHTRSVHSLEKPFQCCYCAYTSAEASRMKIHIRSHTGERPFVCTQCPFASTDAFKLRRHIQTHTGEKPYSCTVCQAKFTQRNSMKMHILRKHTENLPKEHCPICNAALFGKHDVQVHIRKQHAYLETPIKCRFCAETFHERYIFRQHQQSHRLEKQGGNKPARAKKSDAANLDGQDAESEPKESSLTWKILPSSEETQLLLNLHGSEQPGALTELHSIPMQAEDGSIVQALVVQSAEQVDAAELLNLGEVLQPLMQQHSASGPLVIAVNCNQPVLTDPDQAVNPNDASQEMAALPASQMRRPRRLQLINPEDQIEVKLHRCKECDKSFSTGLELLRHKKSHKAENTFKCPFCEHETPEAEQLILHIQIHSEDRPFHCDECSYATTDAFKLSRHKRTHTGERPYSCSVCQITFTQKSTMEMHVLRKHTKELPKLQCPLCDTILTGKVGLKIHIRKQHSQTENALKCRFCPAVFHERFMLRQHLKVHQKGKMAKAVSTMKRKAVMRNNDKPSVLEEERSPGPQEEAFTWQVVPAEQEAEIHLLISGSEELEPLSEYHVLPLQTEDGSIIGIQLAGLQEVEQLDMDAMHTQVILGDNV
ncbi:oocyte zinc finger protein XlCOF28-like isoform X2 [Eleutherodactylus coqui]|uniref:oocyte zinc finger protein XlCOF28-like isoform X2 n=1 Tax=Eleutherodactylus coqui TaxID=57060 RepID=UPI003461B290